MGRIVGAILVLALAALAGWLLRGWVAPPSASRKEPATCKVARGTIEQNVKSTVGYIRPAPQALLRIGFPASKDGPRPITLLTLQEGDVVSPGGLLARLDAEDLKIARQQLGAEKQVAESRLEAAVKLGPLEIRHAEEVVAERAAQEDNARRNHERKVALRKDQLVSAADVEDAAKELAIAQARHRQAEIARDQAKTRLDTDTGTLKQQIAQAVTALATIDTRLSWRELRSPLATTAQLYAVHQRQGELAGGPTAAPVVTLIDPNQLVAHLYVAEADVGRIPLDPAPTVTLRAVAHPGQFLRGKIVRWLPQPVTQDNVVYYLAVVEVAAEQRSLLRVEMSVTAQIQAGVKDNVLWLPLAALHSRGDGWYVLLQKGGRVEERTVRIGWQDQGRVEILDGLAEGDEVVIEP